MINNMAALHHQLSSALESTLHFLLILLPITSSSSSSSSSSAAASLAGLAAIAAAAAAATGLGRLIPAALFLACLFLVTSFLYWLHPGGPAWGRHRLAAPCRPPQLAECIAHERGGGATAIPGPRGLPFFGSLLAFSSSPTAHRLLASLASSASGCRRPLMALSLASTRVVVASQPSTARRILCSPAFSQRPLSQSASQLLFERALGFSPCGHHWRSLRRLAAAHLFSPRTLAAHQPLRRRDAAAMIRAMAAAAAAAAVVELRPFLQHAALNNIMGTVFGKQYPYPAAGAAAAATEEEAEEVAEVRSMVREGFELLGAFNTSDHLPVPLRSLLDPLRVRQRCKRLVPRVYAFVHRIIDDHRAAAAARQGSGQGGSAAAAAAAEDFVDVLLRLQAEEKLADADIVSILWEMVFRGTDTMAILTEWILAELALHADIQARLHRELVAEEEEEEGGGAYLRAVVKEALRMHPPGPLLSWARLAVHDVEVGGYHVPAGTTAMVNMWAITHDPELWDEPHRFNPDRFLLQPSPAAGGGGGGGSGWAQLLGAEEAEMRLAPFGAGSRACPGKAMAMASVELWVGSIVRRFELLPAPGRPVELTELLKLSCEMAVPLAVQLRDRHVAPREN